MKKIIKTFIIISLLLSSLACTYRPILDENQTYKQTPKEETDAIVDKCMKDGDEYLKEAKRRRLVKETGRKAILGSFFGAIFGFLIGDTSKALASGAAIGAGVGGASGAVSVAGAGTLTPDQVKQNYVSNCLSRQGYTIIGWE